MTKNVMSPSETPITAGQIGKIQELLGASLRKSALLNEPVQQVLETQGDQLVSEMVAVIRRRALAVRKMVIRRVRVDRSRNPIGVIKATSRKEHVDWEVVVTMPGVGCSIEEVDVYFFRIGSWINNEDLEKEYESRGLVAADPYSLAAVNEKDPEFADAYPNCTQWRGASGRWCYASFCYWQNIGRGLNVNYLTVGGWGGGWGGRWWFAGIPRK